MQDQLRDESRKAARDELVLRRLQLRHVHHRIAVMNSAFSCAQVN